MHEQLAELDGGSPGPSSRRSPSPEQATSSWLQRCRQRVKQIPSLRLVIREPEPVCVLAVQRYLGEASAPYHYDITVYDGSVRDTWLLSPELSHLVHRNRLRAGSRASITLCSYRYVEKRLAAGLVCIEELEPGEDVAGSEELCWGPLELPLPLSGGRKHYLPLWNNDDPYGELWERGRPAEELRMDVSRICSLQKLEPRWRLKMSLLPLLVRIMHKSRLRYFGKADKKTEYPYQAYFEVADHSGMMSVVMWNSLCLEWYNAFQVGNVILIQHYDVKKSYPNRTLPTPGNTQVKRLPNLEISLNARDPLSKISILQEKDVKAEWNLPAVKYQFVTRSELNRLPHNRVCDVIGLVTYVGRCERKRSRDEGEDFWLYRWVHVIDGTSDQPIVLEIFATSQPAVFENIHPMTYLVCTQMRVIHEYPEDTGYQVYLTTSNESQVFITGYHKEKPYTTDEKVKGFIKWMKTQNETDVKRTVTIGGYHPYPQTPATFTKYCSDNKVEKVLSTVAELGTMIDQLHYREHRRVAIQGIIATCRFVHSDAAEASDVHSHKELDSLMIPLVAYHGCTQQAELALSESHGRGANKMDTAVFSSEAEEVLPHSEPNDVSLGKRRKKENEPQKQSHIVKNAADEASFNVEESFSEDEETHSILVESETSDRTTLPPKRSWEMALWSEVKHHIKDHLHYGKLFPESLPQKFDYNHKELLMQRCNLHPAKIVKSMFTSNAKIQDCAGRLCHYEVTILGINQNLAIDVSLPVYENVGLFDSNCCGHQIQLPNANWNVDTLDQQWLSLRGDLIKYASARDSLHTVCILDICRLEEKKVEICLNRVYHPVTGEAHADT